MVAYWWMSLSNSGARPEGGGVTVDDVSSGPVLVARWPSAFLCLSRGKTRQRMVPVVGSARWTWLRSHEALAMSGFYGRPNWGATGKLCGTWMSLT